MSSGSIFRKKRDKITDIFAKVAVNYDGKSITTRQFFSIRQNKFHLKIFEKDFNNKAVQNKLNIILSQYQKHHVKIDYYFLQIIVLSYE